MSKDFISQFKLHNYIKATEAKKDNSEKGTDKDGSHNNIKSGIKGGANKQMNSSELFRLCETIINIYEQKEVASKPEFKSIYNKNQGALGVKPKKLTHSDSTQSAKSLMWVILELLLNVGRFKSEGASDQFTACYNVIKIDSGGTNSNKFNPNGFTRISISDITSLNAIGEINEILNIHTKKNLKEIVNEIATKLPRLVSNTNLDEGVAILNRELTLIYDDNMDITLTKVNTAFEKVYTQLQYTSKILKRVSDSASNIKYELDNVEPEKYKYILSRLYKDDPTGVSMHELMQPLYKVRSIQGDKNSFVTFLYRLSKHAKPKLDPNKPYRYYAPTIIDYDNFLSGPRSMVILSESEYILIKSYRDMVDNNHNSVINIINDLRVLYSLTNDKVIKEISFMIKGVQSINILKTRNEKYEKIQNQFKENDELINRYLMVATKLRGCLHLFVMQEVLELGNTEDVTLEDLNDTLEEDIKDKFTTEAIKLEAVTPVYAARYNIKERRDDANAAKPGEKEGDRMWGEEYTKKEVKDPNSERGKKEQAKYRRSTVDHVITPQNAEQAKQDNNADYILGKVYNGLDDLINFKELYKEVFDIMGRIMLNYDEITDSFYNVMKELFIYDAGRVGKVCLNILGGMKEMTVNYLKNDEFINNVAGIGYSLAMGTKKRWEDNFEFAFNPSLKYIIKDHGFHDAILDGLKDMGSMGSANIVRLAELIPDNKELQNLVVSPSNYTNTADNPFIHIKGGRSYSFANYELPFLRGQNTFDKYMGNKEIFYYITGMDSGDLLSMFNTKQMNKDGEMIHRTVKDAMPKKYTKMQDAQNAELKNKYDIEVKEIGKSTAPEDRTERQRVGKKETDPKSIGGHVGSVLSNIHDIMSDGVIKGVARSAKGILSEDERNKRAKQKYELEDGDDYAEELIENKELDTLYSDMCGGIALICKCLKCVHSKKRLFAYLEHRGHRFRVPANDIRILTDIDMAMLPAMKSGELGDAAKFYFHNINRFKYLNDYTRKVQRSNVLGGREVNAYIENVVKRLNTVGQSFQINDAEWGYFDSEDNIVRVLDPSYENIPEALLELGTVKDRTDGLRTIDDSEEKPTDDKDVIEGGEPDDMDNKEGEYDTGSTTPIEVEGYEDDEEGEEEDEITSNETNFEVDTDKDSTDVSEDKQDEGEMITDDDDASDVNKPEDPSVSSEDVIEAEFEESIDDIMSNDTTDEEIEDMSTSFEVDENAVGSSEITEPLDVDDLPSITEEVIHDDITEEDAAEEYTNVDFRDEDVTDIDTPNEYVNVEIDDKYIDILESLETMNESQWRHDNRRVKDGKKQDVDLFPFIKDNLAKNGKLSDQEMSWLDKLHWKYKDVIAENNSVQDEDDVNYDDNEFSSFDIRDDASTYDIDEILRHNK